MQDAPRGAGGSALGAAGRDPVPHEQFRWLRANDPVHFDPARGAWLLTRHADCAELLRDPRFSAALGQDRRAGAEAVRPSMLNTDPPEHRRLRDPARVLVAPARLRHCAEQVSAAAGHLADGAVTRGELEVISGYAGPVAAVALTTLLGIPPADLRHFTRLTRAAAVNLDPLADEPTAVTGQQAADALVDHLRALIAEGRMTPDGGIAALARSTGPGGTDVEEVLATLALVVIGGFEPMVHLIGNGLNALLRAPGELRRLRSRPDLWAGVVDEVLRLESPIPFVARVCAEDTEFHGRQLRRGDLVVALLAAGNRDPAVFADPDALDVGRRPNRALSFGGGVHVCLAAPLVRPLGRIALEVALDRFGTVPPVEREPVWRAGAVPHGLERLTLRIG